MSYPETDEAGNPVLPRGIYLQDGSKFVEVYGQVGAGGIAVDKTGLFTQSATRGYDGSAHVPIYCDKPNADGQPSDRDGLEVFDHPHGFNGTGWDRWRNNSPQVTLLSPDTRSSDAQASIQPNYNWRGVLIKMDITARDVGASPSFDIYLYNPDKMATFSFDPTVGHHWIIVYPGAAGIVTGSFHNVKGLVPVPLARSWYIYCHPVADITSLTYSVRAYPVL